MCIHTVIQLVETFVKSFFSARGASASRVARAKRNHPRIKETVRWDSLIILVKTFIKTFVIVLLLQDFCYKTSVKLLSINYQLCSFRLLFIRLGYRAAKQNRWFPGAMCFLRLPDLTNSRLPQTLDWKYQFFESDTLFLERFVGLWLVVWRFFESTDVQAIPSSGILGIPSRIIR